MENIEELAESKEYKNYNSVNTALSLIGQCLEPYTKQKLESVHNKIKQKLGGLQPCTRQCSKKVRLNRWCPTCSAWKKELESFLKNPGNRLNWWKMESWNWPQNAVNIANVFLLLNAANINLNDLSTAVNIWSNCTEFPDSIVNDIEPIRKLRNRIVHNHSATQRITDRDKTNMFINIFNTILNVPDVKAAISMYNELVQMLQDLEQHGITTKEVKEAADRIEKMLMKQSNSLEGEIKAIGVDIKQIKYILLVAIPVILAVTIYALGGQAINNTTTVKRNSYKYENDDCLSEDPHTSFQEQAIYMYGYISKHSTLIGRQWFFERLDNCMKESGLNHGVMVIAEMGYGKSALAANIICASSTDASYSFRKRLAAYYICRFDSLITKKKHIFIRRLASMFSLHIPGFAEVLSTTEKLCVEYYNPNQCEDDPGGCIKHCLISPFERLYIHDKSSYIVVLDALDECEHSKNEGGIAFLLKSNLHLFPKWIKFIVTCRNVSYCTQLNTQLHVMQLSSNDQENQDDLKTFYSVQEYNQYETRASNFLLASLPFAISKGKFPSFDVFYEEQFGRVFSDKYEEPKAILEIICASMESMSEGELGEVFSNTVPIAPEDYESSLQRLSDFIQLINGKVHLWHASLKYWLLKTSSNFRIKVSKGHHCIAKYLLKQLRTNPKRVDIVQLAIHASVAKSFSTESLGFFDKLDIGNLMKGGLFKSDYPLHRLARQFNNFVAMEHLIKHFPDLELLDNFNVTPVFVAASHGNLETLKALVQANARTNFRTQSYRNIINLESAVRISLETHHWNCGILDIAAQNGHLETVKYIVKTLDYSLNKTNGISLLPIHLSCKFGYVEIIKYMCVEHKWMLDSLCLYFASENGHVELVSYLLKTGIEDKCKQCESKLHFIPRGKSRIQGSVIDTTYDKDYQERYVLYDDWNQISCETALHVAVRLNRIDIAKLLTKNSISKQAVLCFDRAGRTPLISALQYNRTEIVKAFWVNNLVETNMKCGSSKHISDFTQLNLMERKELDSYFRCNECTVMHVVAYFDRMWFLKLLGEDNVSTIWNSSDNMGCYPAHVAACIGSTQVLTHLLDMNEHEIHEYKCKNGSTPIEVAASCSTFSSFNILLNSLKYQGKQLSKEMKHSIVFNALSRSMEGISQNDSEFIEGSILQILDAVLSPVWDFNLKNIFQQNILHIALTNGHFGVLKKLFSTSPEFSKQLMTDKDSNSRTPLDLAIANLGDTESMVIPSGNVPVEKFMMPNEQAIFIALDFVEQNSLMSNIHMKNMILKLTRKNYITIVSQYLKSNGRFYGDSDFVYDALVQDKTEILTSIILMQWFKFRLNSSKDALMCLNNCHASIRYCHLHIVARKHGEVTDLLQRITGSEETNEIEKLTMMDFRFNAPYPDMLSTCYDKEGFNVLERAIQGRSHRLVKYLLDIGVTSYKHATSFIRLAIIPSVLVGEDDALVFLQNVSDDCVVFKVIRKSSYMKGLRKAVTSSYADFQNMVVDLNINYKIHYKDMAYEHIDKVVSMLIAHFHNSMQSHSFCSKKEKTLSLVHIAAMHGLTLTLSNISEFFGIGVLNCPNYHNITPLYLAKALNQHTTVKFFHDINLLSSYENVDQISFFLHFYLIFLKRIYGENHMLCIFDYNKVMPKNMYKILKASICIRRTAKALRGRLALEQSFSLMNYYTLFQLKHICISKGKKTIPGDGKESTAYTLSVMAEKHIFDNFAKQMDFCMIRFLREIQTVLEYRLKEGEDLNLQISFYKDLISQINDHPTELCRYCIIYQRLNERFINIGLLRSKFQGLVLLIKANIVAELSFITKETGFLSEYVKEFEFRSVLSYFRTYPLYNYLSEMKHLPFFDTAYNFRLKLIGKGDRFELFQELLKANLYDKWVGQADRIRKEHTEFSETI
ncbi:uncharacterized protein LOC128551644 [Mercenaria mercenaria]|uniref:uncharacterized protein LOC128551644 n=1 Tax=Mercenaria mercenaria TaxID=6596 RepID=UPI00234EE5BE|nr:uncharacterized protein LOC128551644 [Mercenaria mercenaria]